MKLRKGIIPALLTAFRENGALDIDATCRLAGRLASDPAVAGLYVGGSTGETAHLALSERGELIREVTGAVAGRVPVIAQIGGYAPDAVPLARAAETAGADAISSMPPIYYKYTFPELLGYYRTLAESVGIPLVVYNIPVYTGVSFTAAQLGELLSLPNVAGVKFTASDYYTFERVRGAFPDKLMYSGYDEMFVSSLAMGADGAIGTTFNFMADRFAEISRLFAAGDVSGALAVQHKVNAVIETLIEVGVVAGSKAIITSTGIDMGICRPPFTPITSEAAAKAAAAYEKMRADA